MTGLEPMADREPVERSDSLGCPESALVRLAILGELDAAALKYEIEVKGA